MNTFFPPSFFSPLTLMSLRRSLQVPEQHAMLVLAVEAGHAAPQLFYLGSFLGIL